MPFDRAFQSKLKKLKPVVLKCDPGERKVAMEMRHPFDLPRWYHVINVPESRAEQEMQEWKEAAPGWEFRLVKPIPA